MITKKSIILIFVSWLMIFLGYIGRQEYTIAYGTKVRLQTLPIDPNDFFRGDYVTLNYTISHACDLPLKDPNGYTMEENEQIIIEQQVQLLQSKKDYESGMSSWEKISGGKFVYIPLLQSGEVMIANGCVGEKPNGIFIKGRHTLEGEVLFGIEKYFVQQGKGKELEEARGSMKIQVSINKGGQARIVDYKLK